VRAYSGAMTAAGVRVELECITMSGSQYALFARDGKPPAFPSGALGDGEHPATAARRLVKEWSGTEAPKLEMVDFVASPGRLALVFRALLTSEPKGATLAPRMGLPERVGALAGKEVEEMLKTSLAYKLTRV
jgi:ADP-ribose pyrophosphatase YjhB (NUDIX family)